MANEKKKSWMMVGTVCAVLLGLMIFVGCEKTEPVIPSSPNEANEISSVAGEQTMCPVMGGAVNKDIFVEYQGKKVYFCCPACVSEFEKNPEKYLSKLPQFQK